MENNKSQNKFYWVYWVGFFIILALPILNVPPWFTPPAWTQAILFRSILAIFLLSFLLKDSAGITKIKSGLNPKSPLFVPLLALIGYSITVFISTLFSADVSFSFWGDPNRGGGFINFAFFIIFCLFLFTIIKDKVWRKLLDFSLIIGFLVGLIAIFQRFGILSNIFVKMSARPTATLGNPIILALYLVPLIFLALSFSITEKLKAKKYLYIFLTLFFGATVILMTQTRASILAIFIGALWFLLTYPSRADRQGRRIKGLKVGAVVLSLIIVISFFFLSVNPQFYSGLPNILKSPISRIASITQDSESSSARISVWEISVQAFKEKPFFGYGPENFYVAFNKYYNPNLPAMEIEKNFDRAHNSLIQILIDSGIFALIFYLIFFISLLWGLQKIKKEQPVAHGLQAGFIAYFVASLAGIDGFANVFIFFLLSAHSLHLIYSANANNPDVITKSEATKQPKYVFLKNAALAFAFLVLIIFLWQYNFVPLQMNKQLNVAQELARDDWQTASKILDEQSKIKTFFLPYVNSIYLNLLVNRTATNPEEAATLSKKIVQISETNTKLQPYNPQNWLRLAESLSATGQTINSQNAYKKALQLSPNNTIFILSSFLTDISNKDFTNAKEKSDYCLKNFPKNKECLWTAGLINIYLNNIAVGEDFIGQAKVNGYATENENSLNQLAGAFIEVKNYQELMPIYQNLIALNTSNVQYKTSLMLVYKLLGQYDKARELALKIMETNPELKPQIDNFLQGF